MPSQLTVASSKPPKGRSAVPRPLGAWLETQCGQSPHYDRREPQRAQAPLTRIHAPQLRGQSPSCPSKELGRRVGGNPEPDKQHLCGCLDTRQAASFPRADLMFLKSLKKLEACVLPPLVQFCRQQRKWPRLGATRRGGDTEPRSPLLPQPLPCRSLPPVPTGPPLRTLSSDTLSPL